tara:strand:- start:420 stop:617 length:198 start_codon:yes stop_codon:yes gene_type:complete
MLRVKANPQTSGLAIVPTSDGYLEALFQQDDSGYIVGDYDYGTKKEFIAWQERHGTKEENPKRGV